MGVTTLDYSCPVKTLAPLTLHKEGLDLLRYHPISRKARAVGQCSEKPDDPLGFSPTGLPFGADAASISGDLGESEFLHHRLDLGDMPFFEFHQELICLFPGGIFGSVGESSVERSRTLLEHQTDFEDPLG